MTTIQKKCGKKSKDEYEGVINALPKDAADFLQGKIKVVKGLKGVIQQQELFIEQCKLTLMFLKIYESNPFQFDLLIGAAVDQEYQFHKGLENPEWMWEAIDEMCADMVNGDKLFKLTGNGLFNVIEFGSRKNKKTYQEIQEFFKSYVEGWGI